MNPMIVTLCGPDDLGHWFLHDCYGNALSIVNQWKDHLTAAELFGWKCPAEILDQEEVIQEAREWLMENIGKEIAAPPHIEAQFKDLN